ncbi:MAG: FAD-binding oxidoreductase [Alphaproteobacteria bacterium]|nr:FAD-binding oxidoreductase [Alphaproteobacteria bacterium]
MTESTVDLEALGAIVGAGGLRAGERVAELNPGVDPHNLGAGVVVAPASTAEVARVLAWCHDRGIAIVPHGGRTGLAGGAVSTPGQIVLSTHRLDRVEAIDGDAGTAIVRAGVTLQRLQEAAAVHGLSPGIDLSARGSATVGGLVSTNAGGLEAFRLGVTRHRVLGLEAVLADGRVLDDLKLVTKANEGYDVRDLFIGAEGTLGVVTRVVFALVPRVARHATALVACASAADAVRLFRRFRNDDAARLTACEAMWRTYVDVSAKVLGLESLVAFAPDATLLLLVELADDAAGSGLAALETGLGAAIEAGQALDAVIAKNEDERARVWRLREESGAPERAYHHGLWFDVSVPHGALDAYTTRVRERAHALDPSFKVFMIGHLGDGNLHLSVTAGRPVPEHAQAIAAIVYEDLVPLGGSFSAEHGIGLEKRAALARHGDPTKRALMAAIKQAFDPKGIMNPGKVL